MKRIYVAICAALMLAHVAVAQQKIVIEAEEMAIDGNEKCGTAAVRCRAKSFDIDTESGYLINVLASGVRDGDELPLMKVWLDDKEEATFIVATESPVLATYFLTRKLTKRQHKISIEFANPFGFKRILFFDKIIITPIESQTHQTRKDI